MATTKRIRKADTAAHTAGRKATNAKRPPRKAEAGSKNRDRGGIHATPHMTSPHGAGKETGQVKRRSRGGPRRDVSNSSGETFRSGSKGDTILGLLKQQGGVTLAEMTGATGWQAHSVRGFLSGSLKKKLGLTIVSEKGDDGQRRYHIAS